MHARFFALALCLLFLSPLAANAQEAPSCTFTRSLHVGTEGEDIACLQSLLRQEGFFHADITGYFGAATWRAVANFQWEHGLPSIGIVGPQTRAALASLTQTAPSDNTGASIAAPASFTNTQLQALLSLLTAFGVPRSTIQFIENLLPKRAAHNSSGGGGSGNNQQEDEEEDEPLAVADQTIQFGALTLAGAGGAAPTSTGGTITAGSITSGNDSGHWQVASDGTITPTSAGDTDDLDEGPYTLGITFESGNESDAATITVTTTGNDLENTYHVASEHEYEEWAALKDHGTVAQFRSEDATAFSHNQIVWRVDAALDYASNDYGRFALGDFWARAPFNVTEILPAWDGARHGAMLDMGNVSGQGFYDRLAIEPDYSGTMFAFSGANRSHIPVEMDSDSIHSLIMTVGKQTPMSGGAAQMLERATVFTSLRDIDIASVTATTFRPSYMGTKRLVNWSNANTDLLPDLALPSGATLPSTGQMAQVWLHNGPSNVASDGLPGVAATIHPDQNMPPYPRDSGIVVSDYAAAVLVDSADRDTYAKELIQVGIDLFGVHMTAPEHVFMAAAGYGNGWKFPIVFAGFLLDDATLQGFNDLMPTKFGGDTVHSFGEDGHTYIGEDELNPGNLRYMWGADGTNIGYNPPFYFNHDKRDPDGLAEVDAPDGYSELSPAIVSGAAGASTGAYSGDGAGAGTQTEITLFGSPNLSSISGNQWLYLNIGGTWTLFDIAAVDNTAKIVTVSSAPASPINSGASAVEWKIAHHGAYRACCSSRTWVGERLALHHLGAGAQAVWGDHYDVFSGYVDRWVADNYTPGGVNLYGSNFVRDIWEDYPPSGVDTSAPTVSLTGPSNGATVSGNVPISASASDNIGVTGVEFKLNTNTLIQDDTSSPYSITWDSTSASDGSHAIIAVARDAAGNRATSTSVAVTVDNDASYTAVAVDNSGVVYGVANTFSGGSQSKTGTFSFWFYVDEDSWPSTSRTVIDLRTSGGTTQLLAATASTGRLSITWRNASNVVIANRSTQNNTFSVRTWYHVIVSYDLANLSVQMWATPAGATETEITSFSGSSTSDDFVGAIGRVGVFAQSSGAAPFDGFLADIWVDTQNTIDLSVEANRRNFIDENSRPVDLSGYGSPQLRLINAVDTWLTNTGSGGNLTETGGDLVAASSNPSD
ncbi:MAG: peptidoglycan-binding protein [Bradyrhizobiaceae bacterium]|nr:peptidoglycan-binding protein [Bradyrhizobiaceae bacterium]